MTEAKQQEKKARRGRPRKCEGESIKREDAILSSAFELFREQGYQKTSMTQIARKAGIDQSSLYYHFPSKAALLNQLYDFGKAQQKFERIAQLDVAPDLKLYVLMVHDVVAKCDLPFDFFEFEGVATNNPAEFEQLFKVYREFYQDMVGTFEEGKRTGLFFDIDPEQEAVAALSMNEGFQHHYHAKLRGEPILESAGYEARNLSPEQIGHISASSVLSRICTSRPNFETMRNTALKLLAQVDELQESQEQVNEG